jgi:rod shape determining protein RodA
MNSLSSKTKNRFSPKLGVLLPLTVLSIIGVITLLSTTILPRGGFGDLEIVYKQILFVIVGIVLFLVLSKIDLSYLKHWQVMTIIYVLTLLLLLITFFFAPTINYVRRWLVIGGIQIQPSEIAKVVVILYTALILSKKDTYNEWLLFFTSLLLTIPFVVLIYIEPDASMALLTLVLWFTVAFLGLTNPVRNTIVILIVASIVLAFLFSAITGNLLWLLLIIVGVILAVFAFYSKNPWRKAAIFSLVIAFVLGIASSAVWDRILKDYQKDRIVAFFNPTETEADIGFNVNQSRIAIGSGRLFGKGFGNGTQSKRDFLPEHQTDFIFASFAEEFGLVGSLFLMALYGYLIVKCFTIGMNTSDNQFLSLLTLGVGIKILLEVFINIGTNVGTIPATGIPLPLMSAGGSITIMTFIAVGFVNNVMLNIKGERNLLDENSLS